METSLKRKPIAVSGRLRQRWRLIRVLFKRTIREYADDSCADIAAGISYYVLFSVFPLVILAVSIAGLVLSDPALREDVTRRILEAVPLLPGEAHGQLRGLLEGVARGSTVSGIAGILGLAWSASAVMGALRWALNQAWDTRESRPFVLGKLVDMLMLALVGVLLAVSIGTTLLIQVAGPVSGRVAEALGTFGAGARLGFRAVALLVPFFLSFVTFLIVYRVLPSVKTRCGEIWPGALLAAILFEIAKEGFALYLRLFATYDRVYGPLGAVIAFQAFVYIAANVLLLGAEMASEWSRIDRSGAGGGEVNAERDEGGKR